MAAGADGALQPRAPGISAEMIAERWELPRSELDELALRSHRPRLLEPKHPIERPRRTGSDDESPALPPGACVNRALCCGQ